ncbi:MAG: tetratricopeptide repeat protein [Halioglobus sp.]|nr:tetratricopeptide repeat protein [Halioglobus sp.]
MRLLTIILTLFFLSACGDDWAIRSSIDNARDHMAIADYESATVELENALQKDGNSAEARWLLSTVLLKQGEIQLAEQQLIRSLKVGWSADAILPVLAQTMMVQGKTDAVLVLGPADLGDIAAARLLATQAMAVMADQQMNSSPEANSRAERLLANARQHAPDELAVQLGAATLLVRQGRTDVAMQLVQDTRARWPEDAAVRWLEGEIRLLQNASLHDQATGDRSIDDAPSTNLTDYMKQALFERTVAGL